MALFAMSDLHLCRGIKDKPMDVFGGQWNDYMNKIHTRCNEILSDDDTLLIPGDISWATYKEQAVEDLRFIDALPGKKIISRGNHDYWWTTANKLDDLREKNHLGSILFLKNNFYAYKDIAVCGNRGWNIGGSEEDVKIYTRELIRLELSLQSAQNAGYDQKIVMTHYPPAKDKNTPDQAVLELFIKYNVSQCVFGHLHNVRQEDVFEGTYGGVRFRLVSADYLDFAPIQIME